MAGLGISILVLAIIASLLIAGVTNHGEGHPTNASAPEPPMKEKK